MSRYDWGGEDPAIDDLKLRTEPARAEVVEHTTGSRPRDPEDANVFREHHDQAVRGRMSPSRSPWRRLARAEIPVVPRRGSRESRRLVDEILPIEARAA